MIVKTANKHFFNLENVSDENEYPLDEELVILKALVPVLLEQVAQVLGQHGPQLFVHEGLYEKNKWQYHFNSEQRSYLYL